MSLPFPALHMFIFVMVRKIMHAFLQKMASVAIQILMPPLVNIGRNVTPINIAVQTLVPVTLKNVIFIALQILIPLLLQIMLPVFVINIISVVLPNLMYKVVCKGTTCVLSQYAKRNSELKDQDLSRLFEELDSIMKLGVNTSSGQMRNPILPAAPLSPHDPIGIYRKKVVGLESDLRLIKNRLTEPTPKIGIVSIVGMGGIGKTTLARQVYDDPYIVEKFDTRAWVTISQEYSLHRVLLDILDSAKILTEAIKDENVERLADYLYKSLKKSRGFLIVMDDMWDTEIWDAVKRLFPDDYNGSRILLTTRLLDVAHYANSCSPPHRMRFLNEDDSWNLLCKKVFAQEDCLSELREVGKEIARNCRGLPLAIVVIGGLLYKNSRTLEYWGSIAENLSSVVAKDGEQCMEILSLSYKCLPHHLKACFLYMGAFPEDYEIPVTKLISLWAAEGFLRSDRSKSLEEVAEEYLKDLIDRSLILISKQSINGKIKTCSIHDLLREICMRRAQMENFIHVMKLEDDVPQEGANSPRRFSIHPNALQVELFGLPLHSMHLARTLLCTGTHLAYPSDFYLGFRLLQVLDVVIVHFFKFPVEIIQLVNLRYLGLTYNGPLLPSISKLLNLQTLIHHNWTFGQCPLLPLEIWIMPKLRHLWLTPSYLPDPLGACIDENSSFLLENLQSLLEIRNLKCSKDVLGRIPNLKKLVVSYDITSIEQWSEYDLEGLKNLHHLETLRLLVKNPFYVSDLIYPPKLAFPHNLKNLTLGGCGILWENMTIIGTLPNLEVLKLRKKACRGKEWEPNEGEFCRLKSLLLEELNVVHWRADNTHFPCLQFLIIRSCYNLEEVPSDVGEIPTLQVIELVDCRPSAVNSAEQILEYQQDLGNDDFQVRVDLRRRFKDRFNSRILR